MRLSRPLILGAAGIIIAAVGACSNNPPPATAAPSAVTSPPATSPSTPVAPSSSATTDRGTTAEPTGTSKAQSDLSQLKALGIDIEVAVLLDVADDGMDRFLQVGKDGVVDFTGTTRTDSTMMSLKPAAVTAKNQVTIKPPFWNESPGTGSCVADTAGAALKLETCQPGKAAQTWQVIPAGDSGQFELRGDYGILRVDNGKLTTAESGRTGLQTLDFAR
jgi:hypothetical protein